MTARLLAITMMVASLVSCEDPSSPSATDGSLSPIAPSTE